MTLAVQIDLPGELAPAAAALDACRSARTRSRRAAAAVESADQRCCCDQLRAAAGRGRARHAPAYFEAGGSAEVVHRELQPADGRPASRARSTSPHAASYGMLQPDHGRASWRWSRSAATGASELAPGSDIDLLFLCPYKRTPHVEQMLRVPALQALGSRPQGRPGGPLGRARRIKLAQGDLHRPHGAARGASALGLERTLFDAACRRASSARSSRAAAPAFAEAKLAERDQRHQRMGDSPLHARAQHQGGQGRPARPADAALDSAASSTGSDDPARAGPPGRCCTRQSLGRFLRVAPVPVDRALPSALPDRPRRRSG